MRHRKQRWGWRVLVVGVAGLLAGCGLGRDGTVDGEGETQVELQGLYRQKLAEIQSLNAEMVQANERYEFPQVNAKGREALRRAAEARELANRFQDPAAKSAALAEIGRISADLEYLVKITGG